MRIVVIGAGVGGLCAAIRLAATGHDVTVYERSPTAGGKLAAHREAGYTFDVGPTRLTMPHLFDEVFQLAGSSLADQCELTRLDPQVGYHWPDGSSLAVSDDPDGTRAAIAELAPGEEVAWDELGRHGGEIWDVAERTFMAGPVRSPRSLVSRSRGPLDLHRIDGRRTLARLASSSFDDPRLRQVVDRYATYSGSFPSEAPATLAWIAHVEREFGCWHIGGGLAVLADRLVDAAHRSGVEVHTGVDVGRVESDRGRVTGVTLADGGTTAADVVVANVDAAHLYTELLPDRQRAKALAKAGRSFSAFVMCAAVRGRTDGIAHHDVYFAFDGEREYRDLAAGRVPVDPTISTCVASLTDRSMAPRDGENWVFLVNLPAATGIDRKLMSAAVLNRLAERGVDLRDRIDFTRTLVPADFEARYRAIDGAIHGTSSNGRTAAFERPANEGPIDGLFLVGGSAHPGGGLPLVAISARIVADRIGAA